MLLAQSDWLKLVSPEAWLPATTTEDVGQIVGYLGQLAGEADLERAGRVAFERRPGWVSVCGAKQARHNRTDADTMPSERARAVNRCGTGVAARRLPTSMRGRFVPSPHPGQPVAD